MDVSRAAPDLSDRSLDELFSLSGRTAVVTGGARNIGLAISARLAEAGAEVFLADLAADEGEQAAAFVRGRGGAATFLPADLRDEAAVAGVASTVTGRTGRLDVWVNNAGMFPYQSFLEMSRADWDAMIGLNLDGCFLGARAAARAMVQAGRRGVIVNIASAAAFRAGGPLLTHYVASKFGVRGLTQALAVELGPHGIRVVGVAPTYIERRSADQMFLASPEAGQEERPAHLRFHLPLGRVGLPDEVARAVVFAASDLAQLVTGSTILVDAGQAAV